MRLSPLRLGRHRTIVVVGPAGSGKTSAAHAFAKLLCDSNYPAVHISVGQYCKVAALVAAEMQGVKLDGQSAEPGTYRHDRVWSAPVERVINAARRRGFRIDLGSGRPMLDGVIVSSDILRDPLILHQCQRFGQNPDSYAYVRGLIDGFIAGFDGYVVVDARDPNQFEGAVPVYLDVSPREGARRLGIGVREYNQRNRGDEGAAIAAFRPYTGGDLYDYLDRHHIAVYIHTDDHPSVQEVITVMATGLFGETGAGLICAGAGRTS